MNVFLIWCIIVAGLQFAPTEQIEPTQYKNGWDMADRGWGMINYDDLKTLEM